MSNRRWIVGCLVLAVAGTLPATAGSYNELNPGISTKADADRLFGSPLREIVAGVRYDYPPDNADTRRISIRIDPQSQIIQSIDVYPSGTYRREDFRGWFALDTPQRTDYDADGNLVEHYDSKGVALRFSGPDPESSITFFRHFAPIALENPPVQSTDTPSIAEDTRPYLGIMMRNHPNQGILVGLVVPGSAAERGGLRRGDVILEFENQSFYGSVDSQEILPFLTNAPVSRPVRFLVERGNDRIEIYTSLDLRTQESIEHQLRLESRKSYEQAAAWVDKKKWDRAIPYLEQAVMFNYRDIRAHELLGYSYLRAKRFEEAVTAYQAAANAAPDSPIYLYWIAVSYDRLGNRDKAIEGYEIYLQSGHPDRKLTRDARKRAEYLRTAPQRQEDAAKALVDVIEAIRQEVGEPDGLRD